MIYKYSFDPEKYLELEAKVRFLKRLGQHLQNADLIELTDYTRQIFNYLMYKRRYDFLILIENFLKNEIDADDFDIQFSELTEELRKKTRSSWSVEDLKKVKNYPESYPLSILIENINISCDIYGMDGFEKFSDPENEFQNWVLNEYKLYLDYDPAIDVKIEPDFVQLQGLSDLPLLEAKTPNFNYNDSQVLRDVLIFFGIIGIPIYCFLKPEVYSLLTNLFSG